MNFLFRARNTVLSRPPLPKGGCHAFKHGCVTGRFFTDYRLNQKDFPYYNPISFVTKRNRVVPEKKSFYPLQFAPANAVPLSKGTKAPHRKIVFSNIDRHRSGRRRFSISIFRPDILCRIKKEKPCKAGLFLFCIAYFFESS